RDRRLRIRLGWVFAQVLHRRRRQGGYLSSSGANQRMGYGGGSCRAGGRGRFGRWTGWQRASLRQERISQSRVRRDRGLEASSAGPISGTVLRRWGPARRRLTRCSKARVPGRQIDPWRINLLTAGRPAVQTQAVNFAAQRLQAAVKFLGVQAVRLGDVELPGKALGFIDCDRELGEPTHA